MDTTTFRIFEAFATEATFDILAFAMDTLDMN
jgi:hypothetical protein